MALTGRYQVLRGLALATVVLAWATLLVARLGAATASPPVAVEEPWARPAPQGANSAAYFTLKNRGRTALTLVGASSEVAERVEIHETVMDGHTMRMQPVRSVTIEPDEVVTFRPGGLHVMFLGLRRPLAAGDRFPLVLRFEGYEPLTVTVAVRAPGSSASATGGGMGGSGHAMH